MQRSPVRTRPMDLEELLREGLTLYRNNFAFFAGTVLVLAIPQAILRFGIGPSGGGLLSGLLGIMIIGAVIQAVAARYLGRSITIGEVYASIGFGGFVSLIVAMILYFVAVGIGFILLVVPGVYLLVRFLFVPQAIILERTDIFQAFGRSSELVSGNWWRVFGYGIVLLVLVAVVEVVVQTIAGPGGLLAFLLEALIQPFSIGVLTLLYFDLRARQDGLAGENLQPA